MESERNDIMTDKLYLQDAYLREFNATILQTRKTGDSWEIVLDRTAFYPEGGGQPSDTGELDGKTVTSVREDNGQIIHEVQGLPTGSAIIGKIDWTRRFYHMQQHSGQHILSALFDERHQAATVGFHLGKESSQIDLAISELTPRQIAEVESAANSFLYENLPVTAHIVQREELDRFALRKPPAKDFAELRLVSAGNLDCCPCGGTHVRSTGEIGLIKILGWERKNSTIRVNFVCGARALADYGLKNSLVHEMSSKLSVPVTELSEALTLRLSKADQLTKDLAAIRLELIRYQSDAILQSAPSYGNVRLIVHILNDSQPAEAAQLAKSLTSSVPAIALIAAVSPGGAKAHLVFSTNTDGQDMSFLLKQALSTLNGKGGGNSRLAQGGTNSPSELKQVLDSVLNSIKDQLA